MIEILIAEDDEIIANLIKVNLVKAGYSCTCAYNGRDAAKMMDTVKFDLCLFDIMLPEIDGYDLLEYAKTMDYPVIFITAMGSTDNKVKGLKLGADDYITKPFGIKELLARINSVLRRYNMTTNKVEDVLTVKDIRMDLIKHEVTKKDKKIDLTIKEFDLLKLLLQNKGKVLSRNFLLDKVWGYEYFGETRTVDVHIRYLRKKIENDGEKYIETIRGIGYKIS